jgi:hypothetical protein
MNRNDLRIALTPVGGRTTISAGLAPNIAKFLAMVNDGQPLTILTRDEPVMGDEIVVNGRCEFRHVPDALVELRAAPGLNDDVRLLLRVTLPVRAAGSGGWTFSTSFPGLPPARDGIGNSQGSVPLDRLPLSKAAFVLSTEAREDPVTGHPLKAGLNFAAKLETPGGPVAAIASVFGHKASFPLWGTIHLPPTGQWPPLAPGAQPWDGEGPVPGICLQANPGLLSATVGEKVTLKGAELRLYSPPSVDWLARNRTWRPVVAFVGKVMVPDMGVDAKIVAPVIADGSALELSVALTGVTVGKLAALAAVLGPNDLPAALPPFVGADGTPGRMGETALGKIELVHLGLGIGIGTGPQLPVVQWASATVGGELKWKVWPDHFTVDSTYLRFEVWNPFGAPGPAGAAELFGPEFRVTAYGSIHVEGVSVDVVARNTDGFTLYARTAKVVAIPLRDLLTTYAEKLALTPPGDLTVDSVAVAIAPGSSYAMGLRMASEPNPWVIPLGPSKKLTVSDVSVALARRASGPVTGSIAGSLTLGSIGTLNVGYDLTGDFLLRAVVPRVHLSEILTSLTDQKVDLLEGFDLEFTDSSALIRKDGEHYLFQLGTQVTDLGSLALQVQQTREGWGLAAGLELDLDGAANLPRIGKALAAFTRSFGLSNLLLVVSTFDGADFTFPNPAAFDDPKSLEQLPTRPKELEKGVTAYAHMALKPATSEHDEQGLLAKLLGDDAVFNVALHLSPDPTQNSKLAAHYRTTVGHRTLTDGTTVGGYTLDGFFGGQLKDDKVSLFLDGRIEIKIQERTATFAVSLKFVETGALLSGSLTGAPITFGGLQLSQPALEIGVNWEGAPTFGVAATFTTGKCHGSVAVLLDSTDPGSSLVAGSISDVSALDVAREIAGTDVPAGLAEVLKAIVIRGTERFTVTGAGLAQDLRDLRLDRLASALPERVAPHAPDQALLTADPAGGKWYLTNRSNSEVRHYQLVEKGNAIEVSLDAQLYIAPKLTRIGAIEFPKGYFVSGELELFGIKSTTKIEVSPGKGTVVESATDRIDIGGVGLFVLEEGAKPGDKQVNEPRQGPHLSIATFPRPKLRDPKQRDRHVSIHGTLVFLGMSRSLHAEATTDGWDFTVNYEALPGVRAELELSGQLHSSSDLKVDGSIEVEIGTVRLGPLLGDLNVNSGFACGLSFEVKNDVITVSFSGKIRVRGQDYSLTWVPPRVDARMLNEQTLNELPKLFATELAKRGSGLFADGAAWIAGIAEGIVTGYPLDKIGQVLREVFGLDATEIAGPLGPLGPLGLGPLLVLNLLRQAGFDLPTINNVMSRAYGWGRAMLKAAGLEAFFPIELGEVKMVVLNRTGTRLHVTGKRGDEIKLGPDQVIEPHSAGIVGIFSDGGGGRWEWLYLRSAEFGQEYQLYIERTRGNDRHHFFGYRDANASQQNRNPFPPGCAKTTWEDNSGTAVYELLELPGHPVARGDTINPGGILLPGGSIKERNSNDSLTYQFNNVLEIRDHLGNLRWSTPVPAPEFRKPGMCVLHPDGNLVIYDREHRVTWQFQPIERVPGGRLQIIGGRIAMFPPGSPHPRYLTQ